MNNPTHAAPPPATAPEMYQDIYATIRDYAYKLTADPAQADEVTQAVFLKMHHALPTLHHADKLAAWLRRIVYTTLMDDHRARRAHRPLDGLDPAADPDPNPHNEGNEAVLACLARLLQLLPAPQRELLEAVELRGLSQTQYAAAHQLPLSTVKSRVQRARQKLKEQLTGRCFLTTDAYGNVVDFAPPAATA